MLQKNSYILQIIILSHIYFPVVTYIKDIIRKIKVVFRKKYCIYVGRNSMLVDNCNDICPWQGNNMPL